jgi:hypothetical protein
MIRRGEKKYWQNIEDKRGAATANTQQQELLLWG